MSSEQESTSIIDTMPIYRAHRITGSVAAVLATSSRDDFVTERCEELELTLEGIPGDRHAGFTRKSGGREPWYPRGTEMCNERQLSLLSVEELDQIAHRMGLNEVQADWIGGNIVMRSIPRLSLLPSGTRLVFENGAVVRVDGYNVPCRVAGGSVARHYPEHQGLDLLFPQKAKYLRGLVGYVERPGTLRAGETVTAHIPEQWIYDPDA